MIRQLKQQPDIKCCDNYSSCCYTNIYYLKKTAVALCLVFIWHVVRFTNKKTQETSKAEQQEIASQLFSCAVSYSSDPIFSNIM